MGFHYIIEVRGRRDEKRTRKKGRLRLGRTSYPKRGRATGLANTGKFSFLTMIIPKKKEKDREKGSKCATGGKKGDPWM